MSWIKNERARLRTKRTFLTKGTCSTTFFHILNREFGHPHPDEEQALELLAGGILQQGYHCGIIWGAAMGVGAESFRQFPDQSKATGMAIKATQHVLKSFVACANSSECADITNTDWKRKFSLLKFLVTGKMVTCFKLAGKWAPEALNSTDEGLSLPHDDLPEQSVSCASEMVKKMGGTEEQIVMAAGLAGGLGLSGGACGALAATIWMNTFVRIKEKRYKSALSDPEAERILNTFFKVTNYEMECSKICGKKFDSVSEHSEFIKNGGCSTILQTLADVAKINT